LFPRARQAIIHRPTLGSGATAMFSSVWLDVPFVASAAILWFMVAYQLALFVAGYIHSLREAWVVPALAAGREWAESRAA
jgi:hypothetical protein